MEDEEGKLEKRWREKKYIFPREEAECVSPRP